MSLLLDALNKSEKERLQQKKAQPVLLTDQALAADVAVHDAYVQQPMQGVTIVNTNSSLPWLFIILACNVLLFAVIGFFWLQLESQQNVQDALSRNRVINQTEKTGTPENVDKQGLASLVIEEAETLLKRLPQSDDAQVITAKKTDPAEQTPLPVRDKELYELHELPADLSPFFPKLHYNGHLYSRDLPSARMILVNDVQYNEKDFIHEDLQVDQITEDGVIYRFRDIKLRVDIVSQLQ